MAFLCFFWSFGDLLLRDWCDDWWWIEFLRMSNHQFFWVFEIWWITIPPEDSERGKSGKVIGCSRRFPAPGGMAGSLSGGGAWTHHRTRHQGNPPILEPPVTWEVYQKRLIQFWNPSDVFFWGTDASATGNGTKPSGSRGCGRFKVSEVFPHSKVGANSRGPYRFFLHQALPTVANWPAKTQKNDFYRYWY